ncbi:MAG: hypothetical protein J7621_08270 [Niastella sp.]|nr:hypothetical protein [Niastella sp.]
MNDALTEFGKLYIEQVRDNSIFWLENTITGKMKAPADQELFKRINTLPKEHIDILKEIAYNAVDQALHYMLFMFEQSDEWKIANPSKDIESISDISDGLCGELYSSDGWIEQFSEYPSSKD